MSKSDLVRKHLRENKTITSWEAIRLYNLTRLAAVIHTFRNEGMVIDTIEEKNANDNRTHALYMYVNG